jgi:two-component system copper resistance phosphate regulon response regulator CusR
VHNNVALAEDDADLRRMLVRGLSEEGFEVEAAVNGAELLQRVEHFEPQVLVIDIGLPDSDGRDVCQALRARGVTAPVLFLTARNALTDRLSGFHAGGDDYLVKPFAFVELLARVRTLARRGPPRESELLKVGDLEIDVNRRRVRRGNTRIDLTPREFSLLQLLARRQGEVLSRTQIASYVWDMNFDSDTNVVEVAIRRLRAKIDDDFPVKLIQTVRGVGYVIELKETD